MFDFISFLVVIFIVFIVVTIVIKMALSPINRKRRLKNLPIPDHLGIQMEGELPIVQTLDKALSSSYVDNVKNRVLKEHPKWADHEFEWTFFEMKRYFIMNGLLKTVPMFSARVDDIWHEMLMFTREYEKFSKEFYHEILHHTPNMDSTPIPGERAFFDWVYLSLFEPTPNSRSIWGVFLQNPVKREILDDFRNLSEEDLLSKYFRKSEDWLEVKRRLINKMKFEITQSDHIKLRKNSVDIPRTTSETQIYNYALGAAIFYSIYEEDQFQDHMSELLPGEYYKASHSGSGSSCSGFACSSSSDHHSGGDSGGSSCSSCGGGCSS
ncbi:glycine-rich domain-containing protein [Metabacillus arenae]|uniref:Uncharacterized protein n=1 Tax=Metabacillus arenae TaxID=2771434 RepID=A0A926NIU3_9BACI|nr:hypothetical protein [Metabacillus arenae]MBD1381865.1 hypothetical protein [Metabacillus arenae]